MEISQDTMYDISRDLSQGATWGQAAAPYGIPWQTLRAAYYRKYDEVYGDPKDGTS
jgi:hypothetical protein